MLSHIKDPILKIVEILKISEAAEQLEAQGHSKVASFAGATLGVAASSAVLAGGAGLMVAGAAVAPEAPPVAATAFSTGFLVMSKSEEAGKIVQHTVPIIVDATIDTFSNLYSSVAGFVQSAYQKYMSDINEHSHKTYADTESLMLALGYSDHVKKIYDYLDENQRFIYATVARDLFNEQFKFHQDRSVNVQTPVAYPNLNAKVDAASVAKDVEQVEEKIKQKYSASAKQAGNQSGHQSAKQYAEESVQQQNKKLKETLPALIKEANNANTSNRSISSNAATTLKNAQELCDVLYATGQGVALVSRITGNNRLANQVTQSVMGMSQIIMGVSKIAATGWAAGPVGMTLGGVNALIACFGSDNGNEAMEAFAEQLAIISNQIHALHEDMLLQFSRVFTALGIINTNIIEGFKLLHEDQKMILTNVKKLQKHVFTLQDSINRVEYKIDKLGSDLHGYFLDEDRKKLDLKLNDVREKTKRPFNRLKLHPEVMASFKTFNENIVSKKIEAEKIKSEDIANHLTTQLGSAEANTGLLLNFAKHNLGMNIKLPIADPQQWQQCAELLMEMVDKISDEKQDLSIVGEQDYHDFIHLKEIGENWLSVIEEFKSSPGKASKLADLFQAYRHHLTTLRALVENEVEKYRQEITSIIPTYEGEYEYKKQLAFKYDFKQNAWYQQHTADWSYCKGFNNAARFLGSYCPGWDAHIENRKKEIKTKLDQYHQHLHKNYRIYHSRESSHCFPFPKKEILGYYGSLPKHSTSAFMVAETLSETMPLLPLPMINGSVSFLSNDKIPSVFIQAEMLKLGKIKHTYQFANNEFIYKINFHPLNNDPAIIIVQYNKACTLPAYLNPAEAAWHAYMGGEYPSHGSYSLVQYGGLYTPNGDYYAQSYCATPTMGKFDGLRSTFALNKEKPKVSVSNTVQELLAKKVNQKIRELRQAMNERIIQQMESQDSRNTLAAAILEVDASAKILIAFLSILFREYYQRPPAIITRNDIIDLAKHYKGQNSYLSDDFNEKLILLEKTEVILLKELNEQTESAYTPVKSTLLQLQEFMNAYEKSVIPDKDLAAKENIESQKEAVLYGAAQATLMLQTELLNSGHLEAAIHISNCIKLQGFDLPMLCQSKSEKSEKKIFALNTSERLGYRRQKLFSSQNNPKPNNRKSSYPSIGYEKISHTFDASRITLSRILSQANHISAQEYIEIPSFSDHNCCFNIFAFVIMDYIQQQKTFIDEPIAQLIQAIKNNHAILEKRIDNFYHEIESFIKPLRLLIDFVNTSPSSQNFINYIDNLTKKGQTGIAAIQFALAPALREIGVNHHLFKVKQAGIGEDEINDALKLRDDQAWAGHESLFALAEIFHVNIDIKQYQTSDDGKYTACYTTATGINNQYPSNPKYPTFAVLNLEGRHWNYLIPKEQKHGIATCLPASSNLERLECEENKNDNIRYSITKI